MSQLWPVVTPPCAQWKALSFSSARFPSQSNTAQGYISPLAVVQLLSHIRFFATAWTAARQASLSFTLSRSLLKLMSTESVMPSNHLILCHPHLLLPSIFPRIRTFSKESALPIRWPKYWSVSFNTSPFNEYPGLISFTVDWFDLLAVQRTLKRLLQHHLKVSILQCSAFFIVQLSHLYMTTRKTIALAIWTFCPPLNYKAEGALKMCGQGGRLAVDLVVKWLLSPSSG